jgi:hypothetical protein
MSGHAATVSSTPKPWGLLAEFDSVDALLAALVKVREAGFQRFDAFSPFPIHGLDESMGIRMSKLPWLVAAGGATGAGAALLLQWFTNGFDYPYLISGKPLFGLPAAIPITFELTVLFSAIGAFIGLMAANRLPQLYHPVFPSERFRRRATTDRFYIGIESGDSKYHPTETHAFLERLGARHVEELED